MSVNQEYEIQASTDKVGHFIRIRSLNKAKHFAVYRTFTKRFPNGKEVNAEIKEDIKDNVSDWVIGEYYNENEREEAQELVDSINAIVDKHFEKIER